MKTAMQNVLWRDWGTATSISAKAALLGVVGLCFLIVGPQQVAAQPQITAQPRDAAVVLGQDAQFTVTASGTATLTYQWRFAGQELMGQTDFRLTLTNVAVSHLGQYDVVVSDADGSVTSAPASLLHARWTELVTFGRSDSSSGCASLGSWPDYLAKSLGIRLRKYAVSLTSPGPIGSSPSATIELLITRYLGNSNPTTNTLIAIWNGGVDLLTRVSPVSVEDAVASQMALTRRLVEAGARHVLTPRLWPPEIIPGWVATFPFLTSEQVVEYDAQLDKSLEVLQAEHAVTFYRPDMFRFLSAIWENPSAYGFREPLGTDFSCDDAHFNSPVHRLNAGEMYRWLKPPLRIDSTERTPGGDVLLKWSGGSPPFRIERTTDLGSGQWVPVGEPTFYLHTTMKPAGPQEFFRLQGLGQ